MIALFGGNETHPLSIGQILSYQTAVMTLYLPKTINEAQLLDQIS
jgi:hypothetical protein